MTNISDDYESNVAHVKSTVNPDIRHDVMEQIKRNMIKRIIMKLGQSIIVVIGAVGVIPNFLL